MKNKDLLFILFLSLMMVASTSFLAQNGGLNHHALNGATGETIFDNGTWWINKNVGPPKQYPMSIFVNGVDKGTTYLLEFGHRAGNRWPEIAAIYNTGYIRLAFPSLPYGTSFVLGPAYWGNDEFYVHTVQISRIDIDTTAAISSGPIHLTIQARDYSDSRWPDYRLDVVYDAVLYDPDAATTQMTITEKFSVVNNFLLSTGRQAMHEGFKWVQFSSMYIDDTQHDSDSALYVDSNEKIHYSKSSDIGCDHYIFTSSETLSSLNPWVEVRHNDNVGSHGNTPNTIIFVNSADLISQATPQGYITCSLDPGDDNVGVWINHDSAPLSFNIGDTGSIDFTLISQNDPKEPISDVPLSSYWAWQYILRLYNAGITGGCATSPNLMYCPDSTVTRAQMAVFLLKGMHGSSYAPPAVGADSGFADVPINYWAATWIKQLAAEGITGGCGSGNYCPDATVTRAQMAVFLLKAKHGSSYVPPSATGVFMDVPVSYWAAAWIEQLAAEGITGGCSTVPLNYCPDSSVTRAEMAVFLVKAFNLP